MIINNSPVRTSVNYGINNFEISNEFLNNNLKTYTNFKIENAENCGILNNLSQKQTYPLNKNFTKLKPNFSKKIIIKQNTQKPLIVNFDLNKNEFLVENLFLEISNGVCANAIIILNSKYNAYHLGFLKLKLFQNSSLNLVVINSLNEGSTNLFNIENFNLKNANLNIKIIDFGCEYSVFSNYSFLKQDGATANLQNIYLGKNNNKLDYNFVQKIYGLNCNGLINSVGALLDKSCKSFKGTIEFNKGAKKSVGTESEFCFLLSNKAKTKALPILLCYEEDVTGTHSSAVGKLDSKQLFYISSRGLTKQEAVKIVVKAKFTAILNNLFDENLKNNILKKLDEKIKYEE